MIKRIYGKALWAAMLACTIPVYGQTDQGVVRLYLKDALHKARPDTLSVYVEVATVQPDVEQGIMFTFYIQNNGSQTIKIMDPVDTISVLLYSSSLRGGVNLPNTAPDGELCRIPLHNEQQYNAIRRNKMAYRAFQVFDSEEALRNQRMKTVSDIVPWDPTVEITRRKGPLTESERFEAMVGGKLTLEPGERFQAVVQITRILKNPTRVKGESIPRQGNTSAHGTSTISKPPPITDPQTEIIDITTGMYRLSVHSIVFTGERASSWVARSDRVTIQLGEPSGTDEQNGSNAP